MLGIHGIVVCSSVFVVVWGSCPSLPAMKCSCLSGWQLWHNSCYHFTELPFNWNDAKSVCREKGGNMAAPRSPEEMNFMIDVAQQRGSEFYAWIACNDLQVEGVWECDGQRGNELFLKWGPGQPDNCCGDQDCAVLASTHHDSMDDGSCSDLHEAFCVRQAACTPRPTQPYHYCFSTNNHGHILNSTCLLDHIIREFSTDSVSACGSACIEESGCRSFNIKETEYQGKICQLNNGTSSEDKAKFQNTTYFCTYSEVCHA